LLWREDVLDDVVGLVLRLDAQVVAGIETLLEPKLSGAQLPNNWLYGSEVSHVN